MNEKAIKTLEFDKILEHLAAKAISPSGKEACRALRPTDNLAMIDRAQQETSEAAAMIVRKGSLPLGGIKPISALLERVGMGGMLHLEELMAVASFLYVCQKVKQYAKNENKAEHYERLEELFALVEPLPQLEKEINRCVKSEVEMADEASPGLSSVRREMKRANQQIRDQLNSIMNASRTMLQDGVITIRNDRYCLPVKSEYRSSFPGMIHDQSNTGSTVFIEPMAVVQLNNKIKELQNKEKEEIEKVLMQLSGLVASEAPQLSANSQALTQLDFIFAKGALALEQKASRPMFNTRGILHIKKARHPLLDPETVVPIEIYLGEQFTTLLITGPNTGGKTVALKTLGLFTLMGQAGLHIPAFDHSQLAVFDNVFADIGDEQSIEQSLSTFSAHMVNIVSILQNVTRRSLVLLDELGAGTDPVEGAALALAIIQKLKERQIRTAVTTHYSELKVYALSTEGVENAGCEFDVQTLRPTYRLLIGIPGKSNAFAISKRLGLREEIIEAAKQFMSQDEMRFEDVITDLEISKRTAAHEQERAEQYRQEAERLKKEVQQQQEKVAAQKEKILAKAREEAKEVYIKAKEEADQIIKEMHRQARQKANINALNENRQKLKSGLSDMDAKVNQALAKKRKANRPPESLKAGDRVYVISFDQHGTALTAPDQEKNVMVLLGSMKVKVPLKELSLDTFVEKEPPKTKTRQAPPKVRAGKAMSVRPEIDCRGALVDEALGEIDKYLDDAYLSGLKQVTIIHGKGTGALRTAVQKYLKTNPHVLSFRPGAYGEGEMGVTVVELK